MPNRKPPVKLQILDKERDIRNLVWDMIRVGDRYGELTPGYYGLLGQPRRGIIPIEIFNQYKVRISGLS